VDYLAEALRELRKLNFTEVIDHHFSLGAHLNARDRKAVRRTVSGMMKILHPHGQVSRDELEEIISLALEGRRRVKEQLKKMGSFEYYQTSFSYVVSETGEEHFVGVPEQGGRDLISANPLPPGTIYSASVSPDGTVGPYRVEVSLSAGTGKLKPAGGVSGSMKEAVSRAFSHLLASETAFGVGREVDTSDFHVEVIDLLGNKAEVEIGVVFSLPPTRSCARRPHAGAARARRHEHPGQHQARALPRRAPPGRDGQRCKARPDTDREQAQLLRRLRRCPRKRRSNLLWGPTPGRVQGARAQLMHVATCSATGMIWGLATTSRVSD
jgi:hypothetical protein